MADAATQNPGELDALYAAINRLSSVQTSAELLDAVSDYPRKCGAVAGTLLYIDVNSASMPEWVEVVATWGPASTQLLGPAGSRTAITQIPASELISAGSAAPLLISDATESDLLLPATREAYRRAQIHGLAFLPLRIHERWIGLLSFGWEGPHQFQEKDHRLCEAFARQVALMADSMQFREAEQRHTAIMEMIAQVSAATAISPRVDALLQTVVDLARSYLALEHTHIYLLDSAGENLVLSAGRCAAAVQLMQSGHRVSLSQDPSLVARVGRDRRAIVVNDVTNAPDFIPDPLWHDTVSIMAVPMIAGDTLVGVLDAQDDKPGRFTGGVVHVISTLADQISIAVQNAYAYEQIKTVEQSLEDRANFLQGLIDAIPNPIFYKDIQGRYQGFNVAFLDYLGKTRDDIVGKSVYDLSPKELADVYYAKDQEVFQTWDGVQVYESQVRYADGTTHAVIFNKAVLWNKDGTPWGLVGVITDITKRREIEKALSESETRYRLLAENSTDLIILMNQNQEYIYVSPASETLLGYRPEELIGKTSLYIAHPDDLPLIRDARIATTHGSGDGGPLVARARHKHGYDVWLERVGQPVFSEAGHQQIGFVISLRDVTARHQAEEALRENEVRLRLIMENSQEGIILLNDKIQILMANPAACRMFGRSEADMLMRTRSDLLADPDVRIQLFIEEARKTGSARAEFTGLLPDRTPFPIELSIGLFTSRDGKEQLGSVTVRDISDRYRLQQALIEEEKLRTALAKETELSQLKTRMMERIAHEFRTPLAIIQANADSLNIYLERLNAEQRAKKFRIIFAQVSHLADLLTQIGTAFSGKFAPEKVMFYPTDLSALCREIAQELESRFDQLDRYTLELPDSIIIPADSAALKNAIAHVMYNAGQFSTVPVSIRLSPRDQGVELCVKDSGIGILPDEQGRIFEAFFRGSNIAMVGGLGLGLTIARACIELHKGVIRVESTPEQGTTVRIWLPQ